MQGATRRQLIEEGRAVEEIISMKRRLGILAIMVFAALLGSGCASQSRVQRGESTPTEALPKGIASALFPDPSWR